MRRRKKTGCGVVGDVLKSVVPNVLSSVINRAVDRLPVELHLPGYRFCGPGTKLKERLARNERGINELDEACRQHDIAYEEYKDNERRRIADQILADKAWERVKASNSSVSERAYASAVAAAMKAKAVLGGGSRRRHRRPCCRQTKKKVGSGQKKKKKTTRRSRRRKGSRIASGLYLRPYQKKN